MRAAIIGGGLQGVEASYLAKKAGWEVLLVDKKKDIPARGLCDHFLRIDVAAGTDFDRIFKGVDIVIPALEEDDALASLCQWVHKSSRPVPLAFDWDAYQISASKISSNHLFADLDIPRPLPWPACGFPVLVKPSSGSGSKDMMVFHTQSELDSFPEPDRCEKTEPAPSVTHPFKWYEQGRWVIQEYISGPSYSLEVMGTPSGFQTLQVTQLEMDAGYDCKRVIAPAMETGPKMVELAAITRKIARAVHLKGIMDVEVIFHEGQFKVLEIDARLPSQTPIAVYHSTGLNMVDRLADLFLNRPQRAIADNINIAKYVILEHVRVTPEAVYVEGEHIMKHHGLPLHVEKGFFGADEAITTYEKGYSKWVATLVTSGRSRQDVRNRRDSVIKAIQTRFNIDKIVDMDPY